MNRIKTVIQKEKDEEIYRKAVEEYKSLRFENANSSNFEEDVLSDLDTYPFESGRENGDRKRRIAGYVDPFKRKRLQSSSGVKKPMPMKSKSGGTSAKTAALSAQALEAVVAKMKEAEKFNLIEFRKDLKAEKIRRKEAAKLVKAKERLLTAKINFLSTCKEQFSQDPSTSSSAKELKSTNYVSYSRSEDFYAQSSAFNPSSTEISPSDGSKTGAYPKKLKCAITGKPAKYRDPLSKQPFATIEAFRQLRKT